ncbi:MAG TPA: bifunctional metallophosphatase/5'-nucleotidase, partial [Bacteroidales bacterium]|nr:bifunctional metallophosphatase/5'-nucleotidase [Bacteroidales bacterium]
PVDTAKTYLVSTSDYLAEGNDYLFALADGEVDNSSWPLRDIMLGIVQKDTIMQARLDGRIQIID